MFLTGWPQAERHAGIPSKSTAVHREVAVVDIFRDELGRLAPFVGSRRLPYRFWRPLIIGKSEDRLNHNRMYLAAQPPLAWRGERRANCIPHRRLLLRASRPARGALTENMGLITQATSGVEEPFFRAIGAPPGLRPRMAALAGAPRL